MIGLRDSIESNSNVQKVRMNNRNVLVYLRVIWVYYTKNDIWYSAAYKLIQVLYAAYWLKPELAVILVLSELYISKFGGVS